MTEAPIDQNPIIIIIIVCVPVKKCFYLVKRLNQKILPAWSDNNLSLLQEISGLQKCNQLERLYLYDNQIQEIKNLELQVNVTNLWLNNNCITKIQVGTMNCVFCLPEFYLFYLPFCLAAL